MRKDKEPIEIVPYRTMSGTKRAATLAFVSILLCGSIVAVGTYALFTGKTTVNNHLKAGNLKIGLSRTEFREYSLGSDGILTRKTDTTPINLLTNADSVFAVENAVPCSWYAADIQVKNEGSVAFVYGAKLIYEAQPQQDSPIDLFAEQITVTVSYGLPAQEKSFLLKDASKEENAVELGMLKKGESGSFSVKAEFLDVANNNLVQEQTVEFDVQVFATQYVETE